MICDEVAILHKGRLLKQSTVKELTTSDRRYQIHTNIENEDMLQKIREKSNAANLTNGYIDVVVSGTEQLNEIIDLLRSEHKLIQAILPHRQSLEESFVQTIQGAGTTDFNELMAHSDLAKEGHSNG
jgi:ABC-type multidrug transport system ATPase subunit